MVKKARTRSVCHKVRRWDDYTSVCENYVCHPVHWLMPHPTNKRSIRWPDVTCKHCLRKKPRKKQQTGE